MGRLAWGSHCAYIVVEYREEDFDDDVVVAVGWSLSWCPFFSSVQITGRCGTVLFGYVKAIVVEGYVYWQWLRKLIAS